MIGKRTLLGLGAAGLAAPLLGRAARAQSGPFRIGILTDFSSIFTDYTGKGSVTAITMAVEQFGAKVLGQPIEILSADHQNKPDVALTLARKWLDEDRVECILDVGNSGIAAAVGALVAERDKVMLTGAVSSDLTGKFCAPTLVQFGVDSYSEANVPAARVMSQGGNSWFSLTADYALGHALERDGKEAVEALGGKFLGAARTPFGSTDFSSFLLTAQSSGAKVIYFAEAGKDLTNSLKQAAEFGLNKGHIFVAPHLEILDAKSVGLDVLGGTYLTEAWYWDQSDESRAFAKIFFDQRGYMPLRAMVGLHSAALHYLAAVQAVGNAGGRAVVARMQATPVNDVFVRNGRLREDGRLIREMYVAQVKTPAESKGPWDLYKILSPVAGEQAFRPLSRTECPALKKA